MPNTVRLFQSTDSGAPTLNYAAGGYLAILSGCLVNGYGSVTLDSVVVASNVATCTKSAGHGFTVFGQTNPVIRIEGATPAGLNVDTRITIVSPTVFTFPTSGISDQTATGTITAKRAPAGWTRPYSGTNKAVYRNNSASGSGSYLRVDASGSSYEDRIRGYETMSDVDTGTGPFPTDAQVSGGLYWARAHQSTTTNRPWVIVANDRMAFILVNPVGTTSTCGWFCLFVGDKYSYKSGDAYRFTVFGGNASYYTSASSTTLNDLFYFSSTTNYYSPRGYSGLGTAISFTVKADGIRYVHDFRSGAIGLAFPNGPNNAVIWRSYLALIDASFHVYGYIPGVLYCPQNTAGALNTGGMPTETLNVPGYTDRAFACFGTLNSTSAPTGAFWVDVTGPWDAN